MRRRIDSVPQEARKVKSPLLVQSRSLNFEPNLKAYDMQLITHETLDGRSDDGELQPEMQSVKPKRRSSDGREKCYISPSGVKQVHVNHGENESLMVSYTGGRPPSLSSVSSTRTSRSSGYFSSANSVTQFDCDLNDVEVGNRPTLKKVVEALAEEEEEERISDGNSQTPARSEEQTKHFNNNSNKERRNLGTAATPSPFTASKKNETFHRVSVKEINERLEKVDHLSPISTMAMTANPQLTYVDRVILELLETERMYVRALEDILAGYIIPLTNAKGLSLSNTDRQLLFGNIKDIYVFNRKLLSDLENCDRDPVKIAEHFVKQDASFSIYTKYCTNYPVSVSVLTKFMKNPSLAQFFKNEQEKLRHNLPLGSYLLKPVQRILKYHLILQELAKNCDKKLKNYSIIEKALTTMTNIARHINEMKRKHEDAVRIQEIQSLLTEWQGDDLTTYGDIVMEGELKLQGAKHDRFVILFDKMILITKRHEDGFLSCKIHIMCSDLILLESIKENPHSFLISPFDSPNSHTHQSARAGKQYMLTAKQFEEKKTWTQNIKKLILKNHHAAIPLQAQQSIMNMDTVGVDDNFAEDNHRVTLRRFTSGLSTSQIVNSKPRRRSDSSTRKGLMLRPWKKHEHEFSDDVSSDSFPNTPTIVVGKFAYPKSTQSSSPPADSCQKSPLVPKEHVEEKNETNSKSEKKKKETKKSEKYKEAVIYRRHKRRTSQPITDNEKRLSVRVPTDDEKTKDDQRKMSDLSTEDFDTLEDFLSVSIGSRRESISWDKQIVEPFFEQLKKEKEKKQSQVRSSEPDSSILIPMPRRNLPAAKTPAVSDDEESKPVRENAEKIAPRENNRLVANRSRDHVIETNLNFTNDEKSSIVRNKLQKETTSGLTHVASQVQVNRKSKSAEQQRPVATAKQEKVNSANTGSIQTSPPGVPKLKRSLSTQSTHADRRRYFEKLKESRDRRYSQLCLGSDAKAIQAGKVREIIEQHRDQAISSQAESRRASVPERKLYQRRSESCDRVLRTPSLSPPPFQTARTAPYASSSVVLRNKREFERKSYCGRDNVEKNVQSTAIIKQKYRSADFETVNVNKRFSTLTTASLPLQFTSSSSCSSESEDRSNCNSPRTTPKYKSLFQSQMFLSRSYSQDLDSNTRRSRNLVIQTSPEIGHKNRKHESMHELPLDQKFLFREIGKIEADDDLQKDKMSEQVDNIWKDFETTEGGKNQKQDPFPASTNLKLTETCLSDFVEHQNASNTSIDKKTSSISNFNSDKLLRNSPVKPLSDPAKPHQRVEVAKHESSDLQNTGETHMKNHRRPGRTRDRGGKSATSVGQNYVMRLTQQFNQMSTSHIPPMPVKNNNRSLSEGSEKRLNNLRFSTSSELSWNKTDSEVTTKRTRNEVRRHESLASKKTERSLSPRQRPISTDFDRSRQTFSDFIRKPKTDIRTIPTSEQTISSRTLTVNPAGEPENASAALNTCSFSDTFNEKHPPPKQTPVSTSDYIARFCKV